MTEPSIWHEVQTKLVKLSAKPNFLAIKAKGPDYAKNMKVISAKLNSLTVDEIKALQGGEAIKFDFGEVGADCLMLSRIVPEGLAVEANQHFTVALDLKITDDLRRACVARELVNRIQNRRKDQDYAITDKIEVTLFSASEVFKQAVAENEAYIAGETQAVAIKWAASADGLEANDADGDNCKRRESRPCLHGHDRASAVGHEVPTFQLHDGPRLVGCHPGLNGD